MNPVTPTESVVSLLFNLLEVVRHTEQTFTHAADSRRCPSLTGHLDDLARRQRKQMKELQKRLATLAPTTVWLRDPGRNSCWSELDDAVGSSSQNVALAASELALHLVANAYLRAVAFDGLDAATHSMLNRHLGETLAAEEYVRNSFLPRADGKVRVTPSLGQAGSLAYAAC